MPDSSSQAPPPDGEMTSIEIATLEVIPGSAPGPAPSAARTTRAPRSGNPAAPRARTPAKKKPGAAERAALEAMRKELAAARAELKDARNEVGEAVAAYRDAESRLAATRADAESIRRAVAEVDTAAAEARGIAEAARADVDRARDAAEETRERLGKLHQWLAEARQDFAALDAESRQALEDFRTAMEELRAIGSGESRPAPAPASTGVIEPTPERSTTEASLPAPSVDLPEVAPLPAGERAEDLRGRFLHLLNDAWGAEKEQVGLLQKLADECEDAELRATLEADRAACQERQEEVELRIKSFGEQPSGGRGLFDQIVTRIWDAVQAPHDKADRAVQAILKALSAAEFQAGLYAAAHACARSAGSEETAKQLADFYRQERGRAERLRAALAPTVCRTARR